MPPHRIARGASHPTLNHTDSDAPPDGLRQALTVIAAWAEILATEPDLPDHVQRAVAVIYERATEAVVLLRAGRR
jgi:hypothetical protein